MLLTVLNIRLELEDGMVSKIWKIYERDSKNLITNKILLFFPNNASLHNN
jgi:hypothetical protein